MCTTLDVGKCPTDQNVRYGEPEVDVGMTLGGCMINFFGSLGIGLLSIN